MAIKFVSVKCPECGASLSIEEGRSQAFCTYCGTKILMANDNEYIYRHIDEAGVKKAETDRIVRSRELELEEREMELEREEKQAATKRTIIIVSIWIVATILFLLFGSLNEICYYIGGGLCYVGIFAALFWYTSRETREREENAKRETRRNTRRGLIKLELDIVNIKTKQYQALAAELQAQGFSNIQCVNMKDMRLGLFTRDGQVESLSIGGKQIIANEGWFNPDDIIVITYHGFMK